MTTPVSNMDALQWLQAQPEGAANLILTDPPYNIGKAEWDKIPDYVPWITRIFNECARASAQNATLCFFHKDFPQMAEIQTAMHRETPWRFNSFVVCVNKNLRKKNWHNPGAKNTLRSWFNICEFCAVYTRKDAPGLSETGLSQTYSLPEFSEPLRAYMNGELERAGLKNDKHLRAMLQEWRPGSSGAMLRHYFTPSQFEIPTKDVYTGFFQNYLRAKTGITDLFPRPFEQQRQQFEQQRQQFEQQRQQFEGLRPVHNLDPIHNNVWQWGELNNSTNQLHPCRKPLHILRRLILTHSRPGDLVLDPFTGSGSTGEACQQTGRRFLGSERDPHYAALANSRYHAARELFSYTPNTNTQA